MCNIIISFIHMLCVKRIPIKIQCTRQYTPCIQIRIQNKISRIPTRIFCLKYWKHVKIGCKCSMVQVTTYRNNVSHILDNIFYRWFSLGWQDVKQYHDIYIYININSFTQALKEITFLVLVYPISLRQVFSQIQDTVLQIHHHHHQL